IVAEIWSRLVFMSSWNIVSHSVQRFGLIRLAFTPASLNGNEANPRIGIGRRNRLQQPLHSVARDAAMASFLSWRRNPLGAGSRPRGSTPRFSRRPPGTTTGDGWGLHGATIGPDP